MKKRLVISLLSVFLLTACGDDSDEPNQNEPPLTSAQKITKMEQSGELPILERTDTVEGVDADQNGIRDDIDAYIKNTYPNEEQQKAVIQYARSLQASLLIDKNNKIAVKSAANEQAKAISCIFEKIPSEQSRINGSIVEEIVGATTNTKQRLLEYIALNKALDGTVTSLPSEDICDE